MNGTINPSFIFDVMYLKLNITDFDVRWNEFDCFCRFFLCSQLSIQQKSAHVKKKLKIKMRKIMENRINTYLKPLCIKIL